MFSGEPIVTTDAQRDSQDRNALSVTADELIFDENECGPQNGLRLQFEAVSKFSADEKRVIKSVLEGLILKHEAKRWSSAS